MMDDFELAIAKSMTQTKLDPLGSNIIERLPRGHPCAESHKLYGKKVGEKLLT